MLVSLADVCLAKRASLVWDTSPYRHRFVGLDRLAFFLPESTSLLENHC